MKTFRNSVMEWFGYTRKERRSTFILLIIITGIYLLRAVVPESRISLTEIPMVMQEDLPYPDPRSQSGSFVENVPRKSAGGNQLKTPKIEINSCDSAALESLPLIGPVLSARIIKFRNLTGGFLQISQLKEVYGLSIEAYEVIYPRLAIDPGLVRKIRINEALYSELIRHPYFKKGEVTAVLKYRDLMGRIRSAGELVENNVISAETAEKIGGYLEF